MEYVVLSTPQTGAYSFVQTLSSQVGGGFTTVPVASFIGGFSDHVSVRTIFLHSHSYATTIPAACAVQRLEYVSRSSQQTGV